MKRRFDADPRDFHGPGNPDETVTDAKLHARRRSLATTLPGPGDFLLGSSVQYYQPQRPSMSDDPNPRVSMNPPPALTRQLPSPPGRSLPSPASSSFHSPSASLYGTSSQPCDPLHVSEYLHSADTNLPRICKGGPPDALQSHTAALQHEVSVQKIALISLQSEHDKLVAAFSQSQVRAGALEQKYAVSDTEIASLTEEKLRLRTQIAELERNVEELVRSRDGFRQAAVQEGAQYVEIIKRASRLEAAAGEERKGWNALRAEMEQEIEALSDRGRAGVVTASAACLPLQITDDINDPPFSVEVQDGPKMKPVGNLQVVSHPTTAQQSPPVPQAPDEHLEEEVQRLRSRCVEVENVLRAVRDGSRSMTNIIETLGLAGTSILERAGRSLGSGR